VIDLSSSSEEEEFFADTSWDEDFTRRLSGDLNHDILEPPVMARLSSLATLTNRRSCVRRPPPMTLLCLLLLRSLRLHLPSPPMLMKTHGKSNMIIVMILLLIGTWAKAVAAETKPAHHRLPCQEWCLVQACFKENYVLHCYHVSSFVQRSGDDDAKS
jgi:hypothetical protein